MRQQVRANLADLGRPDPGFLQQRQGLDDRRGEDVPVVALLQLGEVGRPRQRVDRIVEIEQQFAPGDSLHVLRQQQAARPVADPRREIAHRRLVLDRQLAPGGAVPAAGAEMDDIIGHHAVHHLLARQPLAQRAGDAVGGSDDSRWGREAAGADVDGRRVLEVLRVLTGSRGSVLVVQGVRVRGVRVRAVEYRLATNRGAVR